MPGAERHVEQSTASTSDQIEVIIPAFNEAYNIEYLLHDVLGSVLPVGITLRRITVICDGCTDATELVVREVGSDHPQVHCVSNDIQRGKNHCINVGIREAKADILVMLDADTMLGSPVTLSEIVAPIWSSGFDLVGANTIPTWGGRRPSIAQAARRFDWLLEDQNRTLKPASYYGCYGRAMGLSARLYRAIELPADQADDLFIYHSARVKGHRFHYANNAVVLFSAPISIRDYSRQYSRYWIYRRSACVLFGRAVIDDLRVPGHLNRLTHTVLSHPHLAAAWLLARIVAFGACLAKRRQGAYKDGLYYTSSNTGQR